MKQLITLILILILAAGTLPAQDNPMKEIYKLYEEEKFEEGLAKVETALKAGDDPNLLQAQYYFLMALDKYDAALTNALKRVKLDTRNSPWVCMDVVEVYRQKEDAAKTIEWLSKAVERGYNNYQSLETDEYAFLKEQDDFVKLVTTIKESIGIGKPAKDFTVTCLDETGFTLSEQKGKVVLVDFWATWCGPCRAEMPNLKAIYEKHGTGNFQIIGISLDRKKESLTQYIDEQELGWKIAFSGDAWDDAHAKLYGVNSIPSMWLVDKEGVLRHFGLHGEELAQAVDALLAE